MARPRKDEFGRCEQVNLRLTIDEKEILEQRARACGITPTDYARRLIFGVPLTFRQEADPALIVALNKIGVNLNQMSRVFNSGAIVPPHALGKTLERVDEILDRLEAMDEEKA